MTLPIGEYRLIFRSSLLRALLISLGLHVLLLGPTPMPLSRLWLQSGSGALRATLVSDRRVEVSPVLAPVAKASKPYMPEPLLLPETKAASVAADGNAAPVEVQSDSDGVDAEGLRGYRMALAVQSRRFWRYPDAASRSGAQGTAVLRVSVLLAGAIGVSLERSSGFDALDNAALTMMREASLVAPLPETLRGRRFSLLLPVVFSLP